MQLTPEQLKQINKFRLDPNLFFTEVLGAEPEKYQREINQAIADNERVAISACHDVGKSWDLARIVLWFSTCFMHSKVITTAPTFNQVKNILWSEIRSAYARSVFPLGGKMNMTEWQLTPEGDWFALGFTSRNEVSSEGGQGSQSSFQGFHAKYILIVFDEATGIPKAIWDMVEGMLTSGFVRFVCIGNPTSRQSEFFKCFSSPDWKKIRLSCFDSPNLIANGITDIDKLTKEIDFVRSLPEEAAQERLKSYIMVKQHLISLKWVVSMGLPRKWGIEHPLFVSKVLGMFPKDADGALMPLSSVEESQLRVYYPNDSDQNILGIDVARFGTDQTYFTHLHGKKWKASKRFSKFDTTAVTGEAINFIKTNSITVVVIDETGIGAGVVDLLVEAKRVGTISSLVEIRGVQFGAGIDCDGPEGCDHKSCEKAKYVNMKARMFGLLSKDLKDLDGLVLPAGLEGDIYLEELPTILYFFDSKGRMFIESKDEYRKRTGRSSPDASDSLALANFGRYDAMNAGSFLGMKRDTESNRKSGFGIPFAASLTSGRRY